MCEQSTAEFRNGVPVLTLPKAKPSRHQAKKIPVTAGEAGGSQSAAQQREPQTADRK